MIKDIRELAAILSQVHQNGAINIDFKARNNSIRRIASETILQFPMLASDNISPDVAGTVIKALEGEYAAFVAMAMKNDSILTAKRSGNSNKPVQTFIKKFHTNLNEDEEYEITSTEVSMLENAPYSIISSNEILAVPIKEQLNADLSANDYFNPNARLILNPITEAKSRVETADPKFNSKVLDMNKLAPITLNIEVDLTVKGTTDLVKKTFMIGVKAQTHAIPSGEFIENIPEAFRTGNIVFRFIQFTTGEISFFKDFLLNINQIKRDAGVPDSKNKVSSRWWGTLRRLSSMRKILNVFSKTKFLPSATMILSMDDVDIIKAKSNVDLMQSDTAGSIYSTYFLLGLVIIDENNSIVHIYNELTKSYDRTPLSTLKGQADKSKEGDLKAILNFASRR